MSKELNERINAYCSVGVIEPRNTELLRECQQRIAELEQQISTMQSDINGRLVIKGIVGGTLYFPPGTYRIAMIDMRSNAYRDKNGWDSLDAE